jgi:hypothetical protein
MLRSFEDSLQIVVQRESDPIKRVDQLFVHRRATQTILLDEIHKCTSLVVYQLKQRKGFCCCVDLTEMTFNQLEAFQQAKKILEHGTNDFSHFRLLNLLDHAIYLKQTTSVIGPGHYRIWVSEPVKAEQSRRFF